MRKKYLKHLVRFVICANFEMSCFVGNKQHLLFLIRCKQLRLASFLFLIIFSLASFSQSKSDITQIMTIMMAKDSSKTVYYKFKNSELKNLSGYDFENKMLDWALNNVDTTPSHLFDFKKYINKQDSIERLIKYGTEVYFLKEKYFKRTAKIIRRSDSQKIRHYIPGEYKKKREIPVKFYSFPILSENGSLAFVYSEYICGGLCGSGHITYFKKTEGKWVKLKSDLLWVS